MSVHRIINTTLAMAFVFGLIAFMQHLDAKDAAWAESQAAADARIAAIKARREEMARIDFCNRSQGPQTFPIEQQDGSFRCLTKHGKHAGPIFASISERQ